MKIRLRTGRMMITIILMRIFITNDSQNMKYLFQKYVTRCNINFIATTNTSIEQHLYNIGKSFHFFIQ